MTDTATRPRVKDVAVAVALAGSSGGAIIAHTYGPVTMRYAVPFVVFPAAALLVGGVFAGQRRYDRLEVISDRIIKGAMWGLMATLVYDLIRPLIVLLFSLDTNPFAAMPIFGALITGRAPDTGVALTMGWIYHFWNGIGFGVMFALVRPRGGPVAGLVWGLALEGFMLAVYPGFLGTSVATTAFVSVGVVGHAAWGLALGEGLRRWGPDV